MNSKFNFSYELNDVEEKAFKEWKNSIVEVYGDEGILIYHLSTDGENPVFAITSGHSGKTVCFDDGKLIMIK